MTPRSANGHHAAAENSRTPSTPERARSARRKADATAQRVAARKKGGKASSASFVAAG
jgi:hypothetical protein